MNWELLLLLACPLMMLFCMKGMFGGDKKANAQKGSSNLQPEQTQATLKEIQSMQIKMAEIMEQNHKLMKEMESMKAQQNAQTLQQDDCTSDDKESSESNVVVKINNKQEAEPKRKTS